MLASSGDDGAIEVYQLELDNTYIPHHLPWETTDANNTLKSKSQNEDKDVGKK